MSAPDEPSDKARYPLLEPEQAAQLNEALVEIVAAQHAGRLTEAQLAVLRAAIEQQTRDAEALHRFPLANADEPVFIRPMHEAGRR